MEMLIARLSPTLKRSIINAVTRIALIELSSFIPFFSFLSFFNIVLSGIIPPKYPYNYTIIT